MLAIDTETSGLDFFHGTRPFFISACNELGEQEFWDFRVDPYSRKVIAPITASQEVLERVNVSTCVIMHNAKFDVHAIKHLLEDHGIKFAWPWEKTEDTLIASHLLASNRPHNLTDLAMQYLGIDILPYEVALEETVKKARYVIQQAQLKVKRGKASPRECKLARWAIAKEGRPDMPSAGTEVWRADYWLPKALIQEGVVDLSEHPNWLTVTEDYANADSQTTVWLWNGCPGRYEGFRREIEARELTNLYRSQMRLPACLERMERKGVTVILQNADELRDSYIERIAACNAECESLTNGRLKEIPKGITNDLRSVLTDHFHLVSPKTTKKGNDSFDKFVLEEWEMTLDSETQAYQFVKNLRTARKRQTALGYRESYESYWLPAEEGYARLHMSLNQTGTVTTRLSCANPNGQQISGQDIEDDEGIKHSARHMFGPALGREWWSFDFENIELRIPAFVAGEKSMIDLFERPDEPPYYGQYHLLTFSIVYSDIWNEELKKVGPDKVGPHCKEEYKSTWYRQNKIGNFCRQYRGGREKVDASFRRRWASDLLASKFPAIESLNDRLTKQAKYDGRVVTLHGYPLMTGWTDQGDLLPTTPLSYFVQGTAGGCCNSAIVRFDDKLAQWRKAKFDAWMLLPIHDEIVVDMPARGKMNLPRVRELTALMQLSGDDIGIPLRVSASWHPRTWGEKVKCE